MGPGKRTVVLPRWVEHDPKGRAPPSQVLVVRHAQGITFAVRKMETITSGPMHVLNC